MPASVIVPTYNAPDRLALVLAGLARQSRPPDELLVADDGSTDETKQLLETQRPALPFPLHHVWQADRGFRKERIVNEAVRRSRGDHLIFVDGDSIPHRHWVADHLRAARPRRVLCGRRVKLGPEITARVTPAWVREGRLERWFGPVWRDRGTRRRWQGVRLPAWLARLLNPRARKLMGVNFSLPRAAFEEVNGYDEQLAVRAREDYDLQLRLRRAGYDLYPLLNRAVVYHLHHPDRPQESFMQEWRDEQARLTHVRCKTGLALEGEFDPLG